ncbi:dihydrofolate reductase family protein [Paeniglutamicibacter antarcticus]|uniref:Dihydrofolate reductase family protein n=1 Tax=Arthrobacter terrae TaxID=2935737 RepID=A0A931CW45_9MICC|nr:dihydrofolate reductase family protein [Arthrobacter terrae]MBG0740993.1 dihydrofolate reductase family protein [Arthrobacter terrae]
MAKLIYSGITSLDGYTADRDGNFDWSMPDEEVHTFINNLERPIGTYLLGRKMYQIMTFWEAVPNLQDQPLFVQDFAAVWRAAEKVVFSTTLGAVSSARTRIEANFDPGMIRRLKARADADISVGGPELAGHAIRAGLVDEYQRFITPWVVGGGTRFLPRDVALRLELIDQHRFANGVVYVRYRTLEG